MTRHQVSTDFMDVKPEEEEKKNCSCLVSLTCPWMHTYNDRRLTGDLGLLANALDCKCSGQGSTPGRGRTRDFSILLYQSLCRFISVYLSIVCIA